MNLFLGDSCASCGRPVKRYHTDPKAYCRSCEKIHKRNQLSEDIARGDQDYAWCEEVIYCPWCGEWYDPGEDGDPEVNAIITCPECNKRYQVTTDVSYAYTTERGDSYDEV